MFSSRGVGAVVAVCPDHFHGRHTPSALPQPPRRDEFCATQTALRRGPLPPWASASPTEGHGSLGQSNGKEPPVEADQISFTVSDLSEQNTLVSFSGGDIRRRSFESRSQKRPVSVNIATLSSYEEGELLADGGITRGRFVLEAEEVQELMDTTGLSQDELLVHLVNPASTLARPPVSLFHVGAVGLGASGRVYVGVNLEFRRLPLACSVHAEQFLIVNMLQHGEAALRTIAVSAAPCGHCRQFYSELGCAEEVRFLFGDSQEGAYTLEQLLPQRFRPQDLLGTPTPPLLLEKQDNDVELTEFSQARMEEMVEAGGPLAAAAEQALVQACLSYAPYSGCPAGLAIVTEDGHVYAGAYIESAAYNPSVPPLQAALAGAVTQGMPSYQRVVAVVLAERDGAQVQHDAATKLMLHYIAPSAELHVLHLRQ
mmetsp:Transcript_22060/g.61223  ORF Transcript_22060/g.61223 Transcript_22060/m.61223 type:complete len:427 (-) Transcript_22060:11-1291(-)